MGSRKAVTGLFSSPQGGHGFGQAWAGGFYDTNNTMLGQIPRQIDVYLVGTWIGGGSLPLYIPHEYPRVDVWKERDLPTSTKMKRDKKER